MIRRVKKFFRKLLPSFYSWLWQVRHREEIIARAARRRENQDNVIKYLENAPDEERRALCSFIRDNGLGNFPYPFILKYSADDIEVLKDTGRDERYVLYEGKKLFFKKTWEDADVRAYYNGLRIEQDPDSPHHYFGKSEYLPSEGDIIADVGVAEGIWALSMIERCGRAYLFESDKEWIAALEATFEPWKDKVVIVNRFVGAADDGKNFVTLDSFFDGKRIDCIKADIEGAEEEMLRGGAASFRDKISKAVICSYHNCGDEQMIKGYLGEYGFGKIETSDGYMIFGVFEEETLEPPYISRGLVFARKNPTEGKEGFP
ncbi:MAG: FkbM family methyltransferase [Synergistaceae bacterium]|jgi:hypothetical protein|nr:FkbM family methyltransferase [Synergistaceae bacterium]